MPEPGQGVPAAIARQHHGNGFEGKRISDVAKRNASLFVTWKPEMGWYAETGLTLVGDRYADNANTVVLPGYGRWDALAGFRHKEWFSTGVHTTPSRGLVLWLSTFCRVLMILLVVSTSKRS